MLSVVARHRYPLHTTNARLTDFTTIQKAHVPPHTAMPASCVMCNTPLRGVNQATDVLCGSALCQHRYDMVPAWQKCRYCTRLLSVAQVAAGTCHERTCRDRPMAAAYTAAAERRRKEMALAKRHRQRAATQLGIPHDKIASYRLAVLPLNQDIETPLPEGRRTAFAQHLRRNLAEARARIAAGELVEPAAITTSVDNRPDPEKEAETHLMNAGCMTCRGECCKLGGDHAFNSSSTMMRFVDRHPMLDDEAVVARYLAYLGERTLKTGCVFQGQRGCTLPREMRSGTCNRFFCGDVRVLQHQLSDGDPVRAFIVNRKGARLTGDTFVEIPLTA